MITIAEAARRILDENKKPLTPSEIASRAIQQKLVSQRTLTPEQSFRAAIVRSNIQRTEKGDLPLFYEVGDGTYGLMEWQEEGMELRIRTFTRDTREDLKNRINKLKPKAFEELVGQVLIQMGFDESEVIGGPNDKGVDIRGVLGVGEL